MEALKFVPIQSVIDVNFWYELSRLKLEELRLDDSTRPLTGYYSAAGQNVPPRLHVPVDAFKESQIPFGGVRVKGLLKVFNTIEEFKRMDRKGLAEECGELVLGGEKNAFLLCVYADLKTYTFYYWLLFGVIQFEGTQYSIHDVQEFLEEERFKEGLVDVIKANPGLGFFTIIDGRPAPITPNSDFIAFIDPGSARQFPSSVLRNFLSRHSGEELTVLALKDQLTANPANFSLRQSVIYRITPPAPHEVTWVGWEKDQSGQAKPKRVSLRAQMNPGALASASVDLNVKLMKWRMMPDLQFDDISALRVLLIGAGTLGCNVARNLLAWGVKHITFVDCGKVSHSNPVRQTLFTFEDAAEERPKAETAALRLQQVFPGVTSQGIQLQIPMPGHQYLPETITQTDSLISSHDVVFLLTDTREARWLPSVICAARGVRCISTALGFDSYLVVRHGHQADQERLGCYFCTDVVAPQNSTIDRTLDQQCTVTRPGLAYGASSTAVEMLIGWMHVSKGIHGLGVLPHTVRGSLFDFSLTHLLGPSSSYCVACSRPVVEAYLEDPLEFVKRACSDTEYLTELVGLGDLNIDVDDIIEISD